MLWARKPAMGANEELGTSWAKLVPIVVRNRAISASADAVDRLIAGCEAAGSKDAAIDYLERELSEIDEAAIDRQIAYHGAELVRLTSNRPRGR